MSRRRGFTLIEATITGAILMIGVYTLINISSTSIRQVTDIRNTQGQAAVAERLLHEQIEAIMATGTPSRVPPLTVDGLEYSIFQVVLEGPDPNLGNIPRYRIEMAFRSAPFRAGALLAPPVYIWRP